MFQLNYEDYDEGEDGASEEGEEGEDSETDDENCKFKDALENLHITDSMSPFVLWLLQLEMLLNMFTKDIYNSTTYLTNSDWLTIIFSVTDSRTLVHWFSA